MTKESIVYFILPMLFFFISGQELVIFGSFYPLIQHIRLKFHSSNKPFNYFFARKATGKGLCQIGAAPNRGIRGEVEEQVDFYNLDMIIAVGYRVSSPKATKFRQWATRILNEYIKKGFVLDDDRLKQGTAVFGKDYFPLTI